MGNSDLVKFWLNECCPLQLKSCNLLASYQYCHNWLKYGDIGGIHAKVSGKFFTLDDGGEFYIAQAVWYDQPTAHNYVDAPCLFDIIAWQPDAPRQWYFLRGEAGLILNEKALFEAGLWKEPLTLRSTPFAWLRAGCVGSVLLDHHGLNRLYGLSEIVCEDLAHGNRVEAGLSHYYRKNMPRLSVPAFQGGAA